MLVFGEIVWFRRAHSSKQLSTAVRTKTEHYHLHEWGFFIFACIVLILNSCTLHSDNTECDTMQIALQFSVILHFTQPLQHNNGAFSQTLLLIIHPVTNLKLWSEFNASSGKVPDWKD